MTRTKLLLAAALFCGAAFSQAVKPDFSGTWTLNLGKSTHDGPADRVYLVTIAQTKKSIAVTTKSEGVTNLLDGTFPVSEKMPDNFHIEKHGKAYRGSKTYWETRTLVFELKDTDSKKDTAQVLFYVRESWTMSRDNKVLTRFRRTLEQSKVAGEKPTITDQTYVFDKQ